MSIKCLKKYLSQNLLKWHLQGSITAAFDFNYNDYNYMFDMIIMFNALQEKNNSFATMNKIKHFKTPILVQSH